MECDGRSIVRRSFKHKQNIRDFGRIIPNNIEFLDLRVLTVKQQRVLCRKGQNGGALPLTSLGSFGRTNCNLETPKFLKVFYYINAQRWESVIKSSNAHPPNRQSHSISWWKIEVSNSRSSLQIHLFFHLYLLVNLQWQLPLQVSTNIFTHRTHKYLPKAGGLDTLFLMSTQRRVRMSMAPPKTLVPTESSTILAFTTKYPLPRKIRPPAKSFRRSSLVYQERRRPYLYVCRYEWELHGLMK